MSSPETHELWLLLKQGCYVCEPVLEVTTVHDIQVITRNTGSGTHRATWKSSSEELDPEEAYYGLIPLPPN